jgi:ribosomal protein S18 acetylase RimI-like enzyme
MTDFHSPDAIQSQKIAVNLQNLVTIRYITKVDLPLLEWEGEYSHLRQVYAETFRRMSRGLALMWLAELPSNKVIGQVFAQLVTDDAHKAYIHAFRVRPEYRRTGIGSRLMDTAERELRNRRYRQACLNVTYENTAARRLYQRLGYRVVTEVSGQWSYYDQFDRLQHVSEPGWRMLKELV